MYFGFYLLLKLVIANEQRRKVWSFVALLHYSVEYRDMMLQDEIEWKCLFYNTTVALPLALGASDSGYEYFCGLVNSVQSSLYDNFSKVENAFYVIAGG